jgi:hypothetical protein
MRPAYPADFGSNLASHSARPTAARELRRLLHDSDRTGMAGMAHAIYVA